MTQDQVEYKTTIYKCQTEHPCDICPMWYNILTLLTVEHSHNDHNWDRATLVIGNLRT